MKFEKSIATLLAALMTVISFTSPVLAATQLGNYPSFLATNKALDAYVVVGANAKAEDVVGAVNLAVRLTELSYTEKTAGAATTSVDGIERDGISICTTVYTAGCLLSTSSGTGAQFPTNGLVKNFHYSKLKSTTFAWKSNDYNYHEEFDVSAVNMRHDYSTSNINGTLKMMVDSSDVKYEYVFDKAVNLSTATTAGSTGTIANPEYTNPIKIQLLGKDFTIVGVGTTSIKALAGSVGLADATTPVVYGNYSIYAIQGSNADWVKVSIKDGAGNVVASDIVTISGGAKSFSSIGLDIRTTTVRALQDGTVVGADLVVGPTGTTEKEYDTSADVTSTGTSSDKFTGETEWGIQIAGTGWATGYVPNGGKIQVIYKPSTSLYLKTGESVTLPNDYGKLGFEGYNTDKFAKITIKPILGISAYNYSDTTQSFGSLNGIEIASDTASSITSQGGNLYDKAYVLFNASRGNQTGSTVYPVMFGFYDKSLSKIIVNGTIIDIAKVGPPTVNSVSSRCEGCEYVTKALDPNTPLAANGWDNVTYAFKLNYGGGGEQDYYLNITVGVPTVDTSIFYNATVGRVGVTNGGSVQMGFKNKTAVTTTSPEFKLGPGAATSETVDVNITTELSPYQQVGKATQDEVVDDSGIVLPTIATYTASDQVALKVPGKILGAKVYLGKLGATTGASTYHDIVPITSAVAKLDSEITSVEKAKNLVSVGGPCANKVSADALNVSQNYPDCLAGITEGSALIKAVDNVYTTGKVVLVVAGYGAADTRVASIVLQQYNTLLTGQTASAVKVTAATSSGITAA